jgi:hypothetical protein
MPIKVGMIRLKRVSKKRSIGQRLEVLCGMMPQTKRPTCVGLFSMLA